MHASTQAHAQARLHGLTVVTTATTNARVLVLRNTRPPQVTHR